MITAVTNFPEQQIGPFRSEVLVLGVTNKERTNGNKKSYQKNYEKEKNRKS